MRASIITIIFSSLIFFNAAAQETAGGIKEAANNIKKADKIFKQILPDFNAALELFLKANELDTENPSLNFKIGLCYFNMRDEIKAIPYLQKAVSDPENPEAHYLLARAYQFNYEFDNAKKEYGIYYSQLSKRKELNVRKMTRIVAKVVREDRVLSFSSKVKVEKLRYLITQRITECKTAKKLFLNPVDVKIENLGVNVNSADPEYGPVISADESVMYFTSRRANTTGGGKDPNDGKYFEDIYVTINFNGTWLEASPVGPPLCSESHESVVGLSADGQKLFLFNDVNADGGDLYISKIDGYEWPPADPLPDGINSSYAEKSVTLSADEQYLFFVSNRPGGV
ncbi:MAG: PD40 domain-containing protein, partial [Bacteroidetes bacterium]|nr:PD40 domain-containing protein [Bacteroidota bacterium]